MFGQIIDEKQIKGIINEHCWTSKEVAVYLSMTECWFSKLVQNKNSERSVRDDWLSSG
ncbi:MAG: hypothetical protein RPS47_04805 [Colwellia sp.]